MKKLMTICLVCVLTAAVSQGQSLPTTIDFNENGVGYLNGTTQLAWGIGTPPQVQDQYATLYYELPNTVVEGDLLLFEPEEPSQISDVLRFVNIQGLTGGSIGRVYVYSDLPEKGELAEWADTGIPYYLLNLNVGTFEQGTENGWNGVVYMPQYSPELESFMPGYMNGVNVIYTFTSDIPEPATICLLGLGALSLIRRKK